MCSGKTRSQSGNLLVLIMEISTLIYCYLPNSYTFKTEICKYKTPIALQYGNRGLNCTKIVQMQTLVAKCAKEKG